MRIGGYELEGIQGRGGMGVVYRARKPTGEAVAIKVVSRRDKDGLARFDRERRLIAALTAEDGFVPLLDAGSSQEIPYFVMPLVTGGTLRDRLARGPLAIEETIRVGRALAAALGRAHVKGIVHRDVKPENVLFAEDGRPLLADLGLAKHFSGDTPGASQSVSLSLDGTMRGTVGYMAPEQLHDAASVGPEADVFAVGAILYECLAGSPAFSGESLVELLQDIENPSRAPLRKARADVPAWLASVVERALEQEPASRHRDGATLARALEGAPPRRLSRAWLALPALLAVAIAGALVLAPKPKAPAQPPPPPPPPPPKVDPREEALRARYRAVKGKALALEIVRGHDGPGHAGNVRAIAFALRDGKPVLYSAGTEGGDGAVRGWDPATGREVFGFKSARRPLRSIAVSADGTRAVVGTRVDMAFGLDLRGAGRRLGELKDLGDVAVTLTRDGKVAHVAGGKQFLQAFEIESGDGHGVPIPLAHHRGRGLAWFILTSPDERYIVAGLDDGNVFLLDRSTANPKWFPSHDGRQVSDGVFAGGLVATVGWDRTLETFELVDGALRSKYSVPIHPDAQVVYAIGAFPDGQRVATAGGDGTCEVHDVATGARLSSFRAHPGFIGTVAVSPDGTTIATAGADGTVRFFDARTGKEPLFREPPATPRGEIRSIALSPDGKRVLTAAEDGRVDLWSAESGALERSFVKHAHGAVGAGFASDARIVSLGANGDLKLWSPDGKSTDREATLDSGRSPSLAVSPDGKHAVAFSEWTNPPRAYDIERDGLHELAMTSAAWAGAFSADSQRRAISSGNDGRISLSRNDGTWEGNAGDDHDGYVRALAFLPSGDLVSGSWGARKVVTRWKIPTKDEHQNGLRPALAWERPLEAAAPVAVATSASWIALALDDGAIEIRDPENGDLVESVSLDPAEDRPTCLAFDAAGKKLWVGTGRGALLRFAVR
jgi:WD40 repeat protein